MRNGTAQVVAEVFDGDSAITLEIFRVVRRETIRDLVPATSISIFAPMTWSTTSEWHGSSVKS